MSKSLLVSVAAVGLLASCSAVGPDFKTPSTPLASSFVGGGGKIGDVTRDEWWKRLNDHQLNNLIERGLNQSLDIATSLQRIEAANAGLRQTGVAGLTSGGLDASVQRAGGDGIPTVTSDRETFSANFVLDLFGGARRNAQSAAANVEAAQFDAGTVRLALLSGIVSNYIDARYYQEALALTRQNIASLRRTEALTKTQVELGELAQLDLARAVGEVNAAKSNLPPLQAAFEARVFSIATLLAEPAQPLLKTMRKGAAQPYPRGGQSTGVPANLLRNRPDVLAAERRFAASVAGVGVAEAQLYPSINLSGSITVSQPKSWAFGPALSFPILNQSALRAKRDAAISSANTAQLDWRAQVLAAVEEVQVAQSNLSNKRREIASLRALQASNDKILNLSRESFRLGQADLPDLLSAERAADASRNSLAAAVGDAAKIWASLMVATGRGWQN